MAIPVWLRKNSHIKNAARATASKETSWHHNVADAESEEIIEDLGKTTIRQSNLDPYSSTDWPGHLWILKGQEHPC